MQARLLKPIRLPISNPIWHRAISSAQTKHASRSRTETTGQTQRGLPMLMQDQIAFFARNGFLHVSGLVPPDVCDALIDLTWERLPSQWSRLDSATWTGAVVDSCHAGDLRQRR